MTAAPALAPDLCTHGLPAFRFTLQFDTSVDVAVLLRDLPNHDRRLHHFGGWRAFTEDESIHCAVDELLTTLA